ncbi:MAG: DUF4124 domain-containing protein [Kangiellaceae bacterium]|jgi:hypothetical protein|nr:DUF4124 domain-containing protein [Kangiellaceae bacterium]
MKLKNILAVFLFTTLSAYAASAESYLYKWRDAEGNIKYGDRPPKGFKYERIKVRNSQTGKSSAPITQKLGEKEQDNSDITKQMNRANEQMKQGCKIAKANLKTLNTASRIKKTEADGGSRLMTPEEIEAKKAEMRQKIKDLCEDSQ